MPTVTAIALETLLEPGASTSPTSHHVRRQSSSDPPSASPSLKEQHNRRHSTSSATTTSFKDDLRHHRHHHGGRREQQPVFLSRRPREASRVAGASTDDGGRAAQAAGSRAKSSAKGYYILPKLYATPEPTQIVPTGGVSSSSPNSVSSPSPYVVNHKRRVAPRPHPPPPPPMTVAAASNGNGASSSPVKLKSHLDGFDSMTKPPDCGTGDTARGLSNGKLEGCLGGPEDEVVGRGGRGRERIGMVGEEEENSLASESNKRCLAENERPDAGIDDDEEDDFFDPRELMSAVSSSDTEDASSFRRGGSGRCHTPLASQSEYYDATEDFLSDGSVSRSSPSSRANTEADLHSTRLNLSEEIHRRKKAEEDLDHMQNMFQRIARQLSQVGSLPPIQPGENMQYDVRSAAQFCQEVVVMRFVSEALESGLAHAETEAAAEAIIEAKNHEIARLRDRLQYYEAMNQEMSQRNQEAIELARRQRLKRKVRRRWIWGCIGLSITMGASLMAYSYLMHGGENPSLPSSEQHDPPSGTIAYDGSRM